MRKFIKMKKNKLLWLWIVLGSFFLIGIIGGIIYFATSGTSQQTVGGSNLVYQVPHLAGLKCEIVDTGTSSHSQTDAGYWLIKNNIGINTKLLTGIVITDNQPNLFGGASVGRPRLKYQTCDSTGSNCGAEQTIYFEYSNNYQIRLNDIDLTKNSYFIYTERSNLLLQYKVDPSVVTFTYSKYGLNLYSTTGGFRTVCNTGCDLSCPTQDVRSKLIYTTQTILVFGESINYLEYWEDVSLKGTQNGGTIYDSSKNEFCFGGYIYSAGTITTNDGVSYIYPKTYTRQVDCCNGATISLTNGGSQVCQNNIWVTINPELPPECTSSISCPGQGQTVCNAGSSGGYFTSGWDCVNNKCVQGTQKQVACCPSGNLGCASDQTCQTSTYTCVGGYTTPPINATGNVTSGTSQNCKWYETTTKSGGFLGLFPNTKCSLNGWFVLAIILAPIIMIILFIISMVMIINKGKKKEK